MQVNGKRAQVNQKVACKLEVEHVSVFSHNKTCIVLNVKPCSLVKGKCLLHLYI